MEVVVTSTEMKACDRFAIDKLKISSLILMENAGRGVVEMMGKHFGSLCRKSAIVFCGRGNNGGDGFVVARHLFNRGTKVIVVLVGGTNGLKSDAKVNCESIVRMIKKSSRNGMLRLIELRSPRRLRVLPRTDYIVDALFGTGFSGEVQGIYGDIIKWINKSSGYKVSVDVPSGVNSDNGEVENIAVQANLTITMGLKKIGLLLGEGRSYSGIVEVVDIGTLGSVPKSSKTQTFLVHSQDVQSNLPTRPFNAHKHSVGKVFILAGSRGFTGAAAMTSQSAMRAGAGAVILGTPRSIYPILVRKLTEVMVEPLEDTPVGSISVKAYNSIQKHLQWADVLILGPGLSRNEDTRQLVWDIVMNYQKPILIDADGLNLLSEKSSILRKHRSKDVIITPHTGELCRLIGKSSEEIELNRISMARQVAKQFKLTIVLKGAPTVTASENGDVFINSTGNPGMATAGSGDVLAGLIGGLWAQGMQRPSAAFSGVYLHGKAGDMARDRLGEKSMLAMDIYHFLPDAIRDAESRIVRL